MPRRRDPNLPVDLDLAAYLAVRYVDWGRIGMSLEGIAIIGPEYFGVADVTEHDDLITMTIAASDALQEHRLLPPSAPGTVRVNHSVLKAQSIAELWRVLDQILEDGLWPQPRSTGAYSEDPESVFFVADSPPGPADRLYNRNMPWIVADLPVDVYRHRHDMKELIEYRGKLLLDRLWNIHELRPGDVGAVTGIPPEYFAGVNGCPVDLFLQALARWGQTPMARPTAGLGRRRRR